ncbi:MAG: DUF1572 domain-containing protein [Bacteroidia bacterium]|nr:DUF1572 domain-containing protein [Bacteroidia bacterium]
MKVSAQIAKHFREVYFGGNWTCSNLRDNLSDVSWQEALTPVYNLNTIATLVYHMSYYVSAIRRVLEGEALDSSDKLSFMHPPIASQQDWDHLLATIWDDAEKLAGLLEQLPEEKLGEFFTQEKYGIYYRNLHGLIEHTHYHLGQVALLKRILRREQEKG